MRYYSFVRCIELTKVTRFSLNHLCFITIGHPMSATSDITTKSCKQPEKYKKFQTNATPTGMAEI
jgi:hypothetical protein